MAITRVLSDRACVFPTGLFHHASVHNGTVYTTGQIGGDVTGKLAGADISAQADQMFANLSAILQEAGSSLEHGLCASIFLTETAEYAAFNAAYVRLMPDPKPPRTCVFVKALPAGASCEMSLIAAVGS